MTPTEADVHAFLSTGCSLRAEFRWRLTGRNRWKAEAFLEDTYDGARVKIVGTHNDRTGNTSFTLVWANCRIRSLDINGPAHANPDNEVIETPHKHRWSNRDRDLWVYRPTDITARTLRGIFEQFLTECGIRFEGSYFDVSVQTTMFI